MQIKSEQLDVTKRTGMEPGRQRLRDTGSETNREESKKHVTPGP
jgi:hypothetical protein